MTPAPPTICNPTSATSGGLGEAKRIAALAHLSYLPICLHNPLGPVANAMSLHLAAAAPICAWLETMVTDVPWRSEIVREAVVIADGAMLVPDAPGLGIELNEDACATTRPERTACATTAGH